MGKFHTKLVAEKLPNNNWALHEPLVFESEILGHITIPAGYQTDFASVPRLPLTFALFGGVADRPAVVHDVLCTDPQVGWVKAADVFLEAMEADGVVHWRRYSMYWAVRAWGLFR